MNPIFHSAGNRLVLTLLSSGLLFGCFAEKSLNNTSLVPTGQNGQVVVAQTTTVQVSGGSPPYTYALISGGGSVSAAGVYSAPTAIGVATVRVTDTEGNITTAQITIVADSPTQIAISAPYSMGYSTCSTAFGVTSQDSYGNASSVASNTSVTLASTGSAAFYTDSSCSTSAGGAVTIVAGSSSQTFYMKNSVYELNTVTLSASGLTAPAGWKLSVLPSTLGGGRTHTCVVVNDSSKSLKCWGRNLTYTLGDGTLTPQYSPSAGNALTAITTFSGDEINSCALQASGGIKCWGAGSNGQVGDGATTTRSTPTSVYSSLVSSAIILASGSTANFALLQSGTVYGWGDNTSGGLGDGTTTDQSVPVLVSGISTAISIGASKGGNDFACAVLSDNTAKCWGKNDYKQLGDDTTNNSSVPVTVTGLTNARAIAPGFRHTCALITDGTVKCWGSDANGQIGDGAPTGTHGTPTAVSGLTDAVQLSTGIYHSCALIMVSPAISGTVKCWGSNAQGQLGNGTVTDQTSPITVPGITTAISVSTNWYSTCATLADYSMQCWGAVGNSLGLIPSNPMGVVTQTAVAGGFDFTDIVGGTYFSCGALVDGTAKCWGCGPSGELGYNSTTCTISPVNVKITGGVTDLSDVTQIAAGASGGLHACALIGGGSPAIRCWGENGNRQLGDGTTTDRSVATSVGGGGIANGTQIGLGYTHSCAVLSTGGVKCWGYNSAGLLADGATTLSSTPAAVAGLPLAGPVNASQVAGGYLSTCVLLADGTVQCWGRNSEGQLGDGTTTSRNSLAAVSGLSGATQLTGAYYHYCAVVAGGAVQCWGSNVEGQLGDGTTTNATVPVSVTGISGASGVSAGRAHSCAYFPDGSAKCWGYNPMGQLGDGSVTNNSSTPVWVSGLTNATRVTASSHQTCAIFGNGDAQCSGYNPYSQLGLGTTALINPQAVTGL